MSVLNGRWESREFVLYIYAHMLLLAIETSSARGSLALLDGQRLIQEAAFPDGLVHGREITVHLDSMIRAAGLRPGCLQAIAVGLGPGSYTGIRVGVTAAKTLAFALRIPVIAESSLRVMAAGAFSCIDAAGGEVRVIPTVDGKQRHVYLARYRVRRLPEAKTDPAAAALYEQVDREVDERTVELPWPPSAARAGSGGRPGSLEPRPPLSDETRRELESVLAPGAFMVGDAADGIVEAMGLDELSRGPREWARGPREWDWPRAAVLGRLAAAAAADGAPTFDPEEVNALAPMYLRASEAERKRGEG